MRIFNKVIDSYWSLTTLKEACPRFGSAHCIGISKLLAVGSGTHECQPGDGGAFRRAANMAFMSLTDSI